VRFSGIKKTLRKKTGQEIEMLWAVTQGQRPPEQKNKNIKKVVDAFVHFQQTRGFSLLSPLF